MISARRHTANRDRHVLRVGLHRRRSHHRHGRRFTASPVLPRGRWWMRVAGCGGGASACPPPLHRPSKTSPACVQAPSPPPSRATHSAFGHTSSQLRANRRQAYYCPLHATECVVRALDLFSPTQLSRPPPPPQSSDSIRHLRPIVTPAPRSCFQRADESTLPLERFTGIVRAGEREPPAASDEEHREPCQP